jgi:hypothetical protein
LQSYGVPQEKPRLSAFTKIKKITYRHFKYNISKNNMKKVINNVSKDYKKLDKILKLNKKNIG